MGYLPSIKYLFRNQRTAATLMYLVVRAPTVFTASRVQRPKNMSSGGTLLSAVMVISKRSLKNVLLFNLWQWSSEAHTTSNVNRHNLMAFGVGHDIFNDEHYTFIMFLDIIHRPVFYLKHGTFWRLDSLSIFRLNLLSWAQSTEIVPISGHQHKITE